MKNALIVRELVSMFRLFWIFDLEKKIEAAIADYQIWAPFAHGRKHEHAAIWNGPQTLDDFCLIAVHPRRASHDFNKPSRTSKASVRKIPS